VYQQINRESFDGKLRDVVLDWDDLTKPDASGMTDFDQSG